MHMLGCHEVAYQWPGQPGEHRDVWPPGKVAYLAGIHLGQRQRHIARHGCDSEKVDFRACPRPQDGDGVILPGIGIDDQRLCWRYAMLSLGVR